jgi:hypothetical protein
VIRLIPFSVLLLTLWGCGRSPTSEAREDEQKFTFDSVKYTTGGKVETAKFKDGLTQIRADSVTNEVIIQGSYGPGSPVVTAIEVNTDPAVFITPEFKEGKWFATIEKGRLRANTLFTLKPVAKDGHKVPESAKLAISLN